MPNLCCSFGGGGFNWLGGETGFAVSLSLGRKWLWEKEMEHCKFIFTSCDSKWRPLRAVTLMISDGFVCRYLCVLGRGVFRTGHNVADYCYDPALPFGEC